MANCLREVKGSVDVMVLKSTELHLDITANQITWQSLCRNNIIYNICYQAMIIIIDDPFQRIQRTPWKHIVIHNQRYVTSFFFGEASLKVWFCSGSKSSNIAPEGLNIALRVSLSISSSRITGLFTLREGCHWMLVLVKLDPKLNHSPSNMQFFGLPYI